ncbi:MerR family transcriptional regulator [Kibdelosporangium phytohabitans]|uniref:HTH merR-type domain-containing protein n=1 Tax=Kibdelosporangium phytohabitans TaxID=860235 RepID=A0A0N9HWL6_9PSEU|nr:MerR family transcriptional regulator [Kibdelosporangium phytohabitans]ALG06477.1 hypothetical protein AOZ06_05635 [Kibdelosporangium phytohabitans]MBE1467647.1 DNA-binding transcriptional MerR regulator [Kibdelosporangium phytohabitans]
MWSIGETARKLGVAVSALRYWDERGVVAPAARKSGNRFYGEDELHCLAVAKMLQDTGLLSLEEITTIVRGPVDGDSWRTAVNARLAAIHAQQQRLATAEAFLNHFLRCPNEDPVAGCPHLRKDTEAMLGSIT